MTDLDATRIVTYTRPWPIAHRAADLGYRLDHTGQHRRHPMVCTCYGCRLMVASTAPLHVQAAVNPEEDMSRKHRNDLGLDPSKWVAPAGEEDKPHPIRGAIVLCAALATGLILSVMVAVLMSTGMIR